MIFTLFILAFVCLIALIVYRERKIRHSFESKGIQYYGNGTVRLLLNWAKGINLVQDLQAQYEIFKGKNLKLYGVYDFGQDASVIRDLLRQILVKDFDHFTDRRIFKMPENDVLFGKMLFALQGEKWKALRSKLSPTFTTGKIKRMFKLFDDSGKKLVKYVEQEVKETGDMDLTDAYSKFTMDIIASAACGVDSEAFNQREPSLFERMGKKLQIQFGGLQMIKLIVMLTSPKLGDLFGFSFFPRDMQDFFSVAIKNSIHHRQETGEKREDFIQLMMEARQGQLKVDENELDTFEKDAILKTASDSNSKSGASDSLDDDGIVANSVLFILAGFDTTQTLLLFCAYALALHQDIQDKVRAEVDELLEENGGEFTYDSLSKMTYLDMVINETLRYYPAAVATDRSCTQEYKIPETDYVLQKGKAVIIPVYGIHHDPAYYPQPEKFDPERFSPENKGKVNPYTFLAFGQGPRNCIGMRFALTEVRTAIAHLVHNFKIEPSTKTHIPMKYQNSNSLKPEGGMWLALKKINN